MYIRFVISEKDSDSHKRKGLFMALDDLLHGSELFDYEEKQAKALFQWFSNNLKKPDSFTTSKSHHPKNKAISWFKPTATEHIRKMREIIAILEAHDINVDIIKTDNPGYVVYEDEFQITAEPFAETKT